MRRELQVRNKEEYERLVLHFKEMLNLDVPVKLSPFKHRKYFAYYNYKNHRMVMFVHNTRTDLEFTQVLAHEMAHVVEINNRKEPKWRNHHGIKFFIEYYKILKMYFKELPTEVWVEFLKELDKYGVELSDFQKAKEGLV